MKTTKGILLLILITTFCNPSFGQNDGRSFSEILQTYYLHKDKDVVEKTIDFVNNTTMNYERLEPILIGFFGALFSSDSIIKINFNDNLLKLQKLDVKELLTKLLSFNVDSFYSTAKISPSYNDMNWSSYFATGNTKYLDNIISNISYNDNRTDINLFVTGASAKWSLCSNARQDKLVKEYLNSLKDKDKNIREILDKEPQVFRQEMIDILKTQREKGVWN